MNYQELETYTSGKLAEMLADGWALQWDDTSRGAKFTHWLTRGDERMCLCAKEAGGFRRGPERIEVYLFPVAMDERWVHEECHEPVKVFYEIARPMRSLGDKPVGGWYTDDAEAAEAARKLHVERFCSRSIAREDVRIEPTERLVEAFAKAFGNEKLKAKNLRITRTFVNVSWEKPRRAYKVEMLNRLGNVKETRTYRLG